MTTTAAAPRTAPGPGPTPPAAVERSRAVLVWALLALLLGVAVPLAPVTVSDPVVSWPRAGELPTSTTLPLTPPRPASFDLTVPAGALAAAGPGPGAVTVLTTMPATAPEAALGLSATVVGDAATRRLEVLTSGTTLLSLPVAAVPPGSALVLRLDGEDGVAAALDGAPLAPACGDCADLAPPQVARLATALDPVAAAGLAVSLHPDDRYASTPTLLKGVLLVAEVIALAVLAALLVRRAGRAGPGVAARVRRRADAVRRHASWPDALVVAVSGVWVLLSPMNYDDSWYPLMARGARVGGAMSNAVYQFDTTEAPFVLVQYVEQAWGGIGGWSLVWMRVLPLLYGLGVWVLLRVYLHRTLAEARVSRRLVPWALLLAHLLWWLPFGLNLRPEPLIVLLSAAALLAADRARVRDSLPLAAIAVGTAVLAVACSPTGLVAFAPLLVEAPHAWRALQAASVRGRVVGVAVVAAAASVVVPVAFGDTTLGDVLEASTVHSWYYATVPWYDELVHYETLLNPGSTSWGRRGPILVSLGVLLLAAVSSGQRGGHDGLRRILLHSAATTAIAFVLLAASPTKWVLHFPAVQASATVLVAMALLRAALPAKERSLATVAGVAVLVIAASISFAGADAWPPFDRGMPFGNAAVADPDSRLAQSQLAPHLGDVYLRNPLVWLAVAGLAVAWVAWARRRAVRDPASRAARLPRPEPERVVLGAVCLTLVLGMLAAFAIAPLRQYPGWSIAYSNARDIVREPCGLAGVVTVGSTAGLDPSQQLGAPVGPGLTTGDFTTSATVPPPRPVPGLGTVWHDAVPGGAGRGATATPWFPLPPRAEGPGAATDVVVPVLDGGSGRTVAVEFTAADPAAPTPPVSERLTLDPKANPRTWALVPVTLVGREQATAVRAVVDAGPPSAQTLAVGAPRLVHPIPFGPVIEDRPVRADQMSSALWPCVDQTVVTDGVAPFAQWRLRATDRGEGFNDLWTDRTLGGAWRTDDLNDTYVRVPAALPPGGPPSLPWGSVEAVVPALPVLAVDVAQGSVTRAGWYRGPTLATESYAGIPYQGTVG